MFTFPMMNFRKTSGSRVALRSAAVATALVASLGLAACGDDDKDDDTTTAVTTAESTAETAAADAADTSDDATGDEPSVTTDENGVTVDSGDGNTATFGDDGMRVESDDGASAEIGEDGSVHVDDGNGNVVDVPGVPGLGDALGNLN
ncbi:hypothetical protein ACTXOB_13405 [Corynebacterium casei]